MLFGFGRPYIFFHFYWKCFLLFLFPLFLFWMVWIFFCRLQKYWCKLHLNHTIIYSLKFLNHWRSVFCTYPLFMHSFSLTDDAYSLFLYCDWNGTRTIVIVQQTTKWKIIIIIWWRFCQFCHSSVLYLNDNLWPSRRCW